MEEAVVSANEAAAAVAGAAASEAASSDMHPGLAVLARRHGTVATVASLEGRGTPQSAESAKPPTPSVFLHPSPADSPRATSGDDERANPFLAATF